MEVKDLFKEWLATHFPDRAEHVMSLIRQMRNGKEYDSTFGSRMRGEGEFAQLLAMRFKLACKRFNLNESANFQLDTQSFKPPNLSTQMDLFDKLFLKKQASNLRTKALCFDRAEKCWIYTLWNKQGDVRR
jgi:hypothetical protein